MKQSLANYALFNAVWAAAVLGSAEGYLWSGFLAALGMLAVHLWMVEDRRAELTFVAAVATIGVVVDSILNGAGLFLYPTSEAWTLPTAPPWIWGLWLGFAMLPRFSLGWLCQRPLLATVLGAVGGPLSFLGGVKIGSIAPGEDATWLILAIEYAVAMPLMAVLAPGGNPDGQAQRRFGAAAGDGLSEPVEEG